MATAPNTPDLKINNHHFSIYHQQSKGYTGRICQSCIQLVIFDVIFIGFIDLTGDLFNWCVVWKFSRSCLLRLRYSRRSHSVYCWRNSCCANQSMIPTLIFYVDCISQQFFSYFVCIYNFFSVRMFFVKIPSTSWLLFSSENEKQIVRWI